MDDGGWDHEDDEVEGGDEDEDEDEQGAGHENDGFGMPAVRCLCTFLMVCPSSAQTDKKCACSSMIWRRLGRDAILCQTGMEKPGKENALLVRSANKF